MVLDRRSAIPLHVQVYDELSELVDQGEMGPGDKLPSEGDLAERYGVNRLTVRQAIADLARAGLVVARQGSGTFVAPRPAPIEVDFTPTEWLVEHERVRRAGIEQGQAFVEEFLSARCDEARSEPLDQLGEGELVLIESVMRTPEHAITRSKYWLRTDWSLDDVRQRGLRDFGTSALIEIVGEPMYYGWRSFDAVAASRRDASVLDVPTGSPILERCGLNTDRAGAPLMYLERRAPSRRLRILIRNQPRLDE